MRRFRIFPAACVLLGSLVIVSTGYGQTTKYRVLHSFGGEGDGTSPGTTLVLNRKGRLFGTTQEGGSSGCSSNGCGTAFELSGQNGRWNEKLLLDFSTTNDFFPSPVGSLALDAKGNIYGTNQYTGDPSCNCGWIFQLTQVNGVWVQNNLHNFVGGTTDGKYPQGLVQDAAGNLYGSTQQGGLYNTGTIFELSSNADGSWSYSVIHSFGLGTDGQFPSGPLTIDASGNLYGTTFEGGQNDFGTAFRLTYSDGTWIETILYNFSTDYAFEPEPSGVAVSVNGNLYGVTQNGGEYGLGTIYELSPRAGFWKQTVLHTFTGNNDGSYPNGGLMIDQTGALYGTANRGGLYNFGTVFKLTKGAKGFWTATALHTFSGTDGALPTLGVMMDPSGNLYGVTSSGGAYGPGVAFEIVP